jgi:hypothetical protein
MPDLKDAVSTEETSQVLTKPLTDYNTAGVKYQEALEDHFGDVNKVLARRKPADYEAIKGHALLSSTHPDLAVRQRVLKDAWSAADRAGWEKTFDKYIGTKPGLADQTRDFFTETERVKLWMDREPEVGKLRDTPPVADDRIVNAMTGDNRTAATEYKAETKRLSDGMLDRLKVQAEEQTKAHRFGNGIGWYLAAGAFDMWYDNNYYKDAKPTYLTYAGDIAQMAIAAVPVTRRIGFAWKVAGLVGTHFMGRALDAQNQGKA